MALESIKNINVDFYDDRYILINAKQYDGDSRYITVTGYDQGKIFNLSPSKHTVYIRHRKPDGNTVFNFCTITPRGQIELELTEQMLASSGVCDVDLVVIHKGNAVVNVDTGEIITVDNSAIISTMVFRIYVYESAVDNSLIESSNEYNGLNDLLTRAEANYQQVINASEEWALNSQSWAIGGTDVEGRKNVEDTDNAKYYSRLSRSYAIGDADDVRSNEDVDNSKYYSEQSSASADAAKSSEDNARLSEENASTSEANAKASENASKTSENNAKTSEINASNSADAAKDSEDKAKISETNAKSSENASKTSETNAKTSEDNAKASESNAKTSETNAKTSEINARDYCSEIKSVVDGLNSGFIPMGTISFSELSTKEKITGFTYNISDDFVTDDSFAEGSGKTYTAGVNVYCRADNLWDCFGGSASPTATLNEVKEYLGI